LDLGFERVDLRDPELVAVRPRASMTPGVPVAVTDPQATAPRTN
jgi:cell division protein FtsQ